MAGDGDGGAPPQFRRLLVPDDLCVVVVAVQAQRLPQRLLVGIVSAGAAQVDPMRAQLGVAAVAALQLPAVFTAPTGVHDAEAACGEGGEHRRMCGDRGGNSFAADEAGAHELIGVAAVDFSAGGAGGGPAVAA